MRKYTIVLVLSIAVGSGCGRSPAAPSSAVTLTSTQGTRSPLTLAGQSNAEYLSPYLTAVYPGAVRTAAVSGEPISYWDWTDPGTSGAGWRALAPSLSADLRALVWWQGESDRGNPRYAADMARLFAHIRQVAGNAHLPILVVQLENVPEFQDLRAAQVDAISADPDSRLVQTDGVPLRPGEVHMTDDGYRTMSDRIVTALP